MSVEAANIIAPALVLGSLAAFIVVIIIYFRGTKK